MDFENRRSRAARSRAEDILVRLAVALGKNSQDVVIIGGLNPDFLAPNAPAEHLGTTDVDVLLELGFQWDRDDLDFSWLADALESAGYDPVNDSGWRWSGSQDGYAVKIEFICDVADNVGATVVLPGTADVAAINLKGPAPALTDTITRELKVSESVRQIYPDAPETVALRFASLGGYLLAKASAIVGRHQAKDEYDFMFVTLFNDEGGPDAAGQRARRAMPSNPNHDHGADLRAALARFTDGNRAGGVTFARMSQEAGDDEEFETLVEDASSGARRFLSAFEGEPDGAR